MSPICQIEHSINVFCVLFGNANLAIYSTSHIGNRRAPLLIILSLQGPINPPSPTDKVNAIPSQSQPPKELFCESCGALVGEEQPSLRGLKLHKTNISVSKNKSQNGANEETTWETFPADKIIAAQLLVLIDRTGARRFIIHAGEGHSSCGMLVRIYPDQPAGFATAYYNPCRYGSSTPPYATPLRLYPPFPLNKR